ncbi:hypothetical protein [Actinomadura gamaensis]|uniref:V-type ATPase subunit n=1 Tax=Actinomadura gamaensis TaxID=1763541 RepID=A0ABV9TSK2_9ACTN
MLAGSASSAEALAGLAATSYGARVARAGDLADAQHAVSATLVWHLRVLAGWLPEPGVRLLRALAAEFELANLDGLMERADGRPAEPEFVLGSLETAWRRLRDASGRAGLRERLAASAWGDPGSDDPYAIRLFLRLRAAERLAARSAQARPWALGTAAVLVAGERFGTGRPLPSGAGERAAVLLGRGCPTASDLPRLIERLPRAARWPLAGLEDPAELWRARTRWWRRVDRDARSLAASSAADARPVLGAAALLLVDAHRVRAALETAARGGGDLEAYDALV